MLQDEVIKSLREWTNLNPPEVSPKEWAKLNPKYPEMSGSQWQERMLALIDKLKALPPIIESVKHWDINIGNELWDIGVSLMQRATKLSNPNVLYPADSVKYAKLVTDLRSDTSNFADRLQTVLTMVKGTIEVSSAKIEPKVSAKTKGKQTTALALLAEHPEWSNTKIAKEAGCARESLYVMERFMKAREIQKKVGRKNMPRGYKNKETGKMDVWDESRNDE